MGKEGIKYPYLPEGREIKFVSEKNIFIREAKKICKKKGCIAHPTGAVLVKKNKIIGKGTNAAKKIKDCPRALKKSKTGQDYHLCKKICLQEGHAEAMAIKDAQENKRSIRGADLYLYGHWWCCKDCWDKIIKEGIEEVYLIENAFDKFHKRI